MTSTSNISTKPEYSKFVLLGTCLGDGCLSRAKLTHNAHLTLNHCEAQLPWLEWKVLQLRGLFNTVVPRRFNTVRFPSVGVSTKSLPELTELYVRLYSGPSTKSGRPSKLLTRDLLDEVDNLALAMWFCDDGYLSLRPHSRHQAKLLLGGWTPEVYKMVRDWFAQQGLLGTICPDKRGNSVELVFMIDSTEILLSRISSFVPVCMARKVGGDPPFSRVRRN